MRTGRPKVYLKLSAEEENLLREALKSDQSKIRDKARLILKAKEAKYSIRALSELLCISTTTIQQWYNKWRQGGYEQLMEVKKAPGNPPNLSQELQKQLRNKLEEGVVNVEEVQKWLAEQGVKFSYSGTYYWMGKQKRS